MEELLVIGGGLSGCEAAWQAAQRGIQVRLLEMRPQVMTGAHTGSLLAELVCSNSLGSNLPDRASGLLKAELRTLGSMVLKCADESALPAGGALAVDRDHFARLVTDRIESHPNIQVFRKEVTEIPEGSVIVASGPLTSRRLCEAIEKITGRDHLFFFDAIAPIVTFESINHEIVYRASRYDRGVLDNGDYLNCPMTKEEYEVFLDALLKAERITLREFEVDLENGVRTGIHQYFEGCLPVEIIAQRGSNALTYGPLRPVGLIDPRSGKRPYAVVQLRQDNLAGSLFNLVGFQTNLAFDEQRRVFRMIPGLENAEFVRYGQMHRNTFIFSPELLRPTLECARKPALFFAGQITGVEGYVGNIASGYVAGVNASRILRGGNAIEFPPETMIGALCYYISHADPADFQPMKANFGILPPLEGDIPKGKRMRCEAYSRRSLHRLNEILNSIES